MSWRRVVFGALLAMAALLAAWLAWQFHAPGRRIWGFAVYGIDVSKWQPRIDWRRAKRDRLAFVFVKATQGAAQQDPSFEAHWRQAGEAGFLRGAYHYFVLADDPEAQAGNFCRTLPRGDEQLPPVVDVEEFPGKNLDSLRSRLQTMLQRLEACAGRRPMIYASRNYYQAFLAGYFDGYPLWVANYQQFPTPSDPALQRDWDFWQFSNTGQVKGIEGPVDLDVFRGGFADLQRLCQPLADTATAGGAVP